MYKLTIGLLAITITLAIATIWNRQSLMAHKPDYLIEMSENYKDRENFQLLKRGGAISYNKVEAGLNRYQKEATKNLATYKDAGIMGWEDLGPTNVGGRVRGFAVHPTNNNIILAGAAAGGIWRSTDGGTNWTLTTPTVQAYPVTCIVFDPFNSNRLYATTGEYRGGGPEFPGVGVLRSTNGGVSWSVLPSPDGQNFLWLSKIVMNPLLQNSFYVVGSRADVARNGASGVIYRTNDAGQNWTTEWIDFSTEIIQDIEINALDTSEIIIGTLNGAWISNNSATTFTSFINANDITTPAGWTGERCEVEYCEGNYNVIWVSRFLRDDTDNNGFFDAYRTMLWRSNNGGDTWTNLFDAQGTNVTVNPLARQGNYSHVLKADPNNTSRALLGGIDLWKYQNNSLTRITRWQDDINGNSNGNNNSVHADFHVIVPYQNYNGTTNNGMWVCNDGGIYGSNNIWTATTNSGWFARNGDINITQLYGADISLDGDDVIGGSQDNSWFDDVNNNNGLQTYNTFSTGDGGFVAINKSNSNTRFGTTQNGSIYRSTDNGTNYCHIAQFDGGTQFIAVCNPFFSISDDPIFIAPFKMAPSNNNTLFVGAHQLWRSTDNGNTWTSIKASLGLADQTDQISAIDVANGTTNNIVVGHGNGQVFRTTNGGTSWTRIDNNGIGLSGDYVTDVAISPLNSNTIAVTTGGYNQTNIYVSFDGGATWNDRSLDFDMHVETVTWHPTVSGWLYVGTDAGLLASNNSGGTWNADPINDEGNDGPVFTQVAELFWQGNGTDATPYYLCAATHGRGIWRTSHPVRRDIYVDKNCNPCGEGSFSSPYQTFTEAAAAAGSGSMITFKTGGTYNDVTSSILINQRIGIQKLNSSVANIVINGS